MKSLKLITVFVLSAVGFISVEVHESINDKIYNEIYTPVNANSLIIEAKKINDSLSYLNQNKALKAKNRLKKIKIDSVKKDKAIEKQKKHIKYLSSENTKLKNENKELSEKLQVMYNKKDTLNIENKRGGFFKRMFSKNNKK